MLVERADIVGDLRQVVIRFFVVAQRARRQEGNALVQHAGVARRCRHSGRSAGAATGNRRKSVSARHARPADATSAARLLRGIDVPRRGADARGATAAGHAPGPSRPATGRGSRTRLPIDKSRSASRPEPGAASEAPRRSRTPTYPRSGRSSRHSSGAARKGGLRRPRCGARPGRRSSCGRRGRRRSLGAPTGRRGRRRTGSDVVSRRLDHAAGAHQRRSRNGHVPRREAVLGCCDHGAEREDRRAPTFSPIRSGSPSSISPRLPTRNVHHSRRCVSSCPSLPLH